MAYEFKTQPWEHQKAAIRKAWDDPGFGFIMETGTGKTKVAIDETCLMYEEGDMIDGAVYIAPKGVYLNWLETEIPTHMPEVYRERARVVEWRPGGGPKYHQDRLARLLQPHSGLRVLVLNTEAIGMGDLAYGYLEDFLRSGRMAIYADESTKFKTPGAIRTKKLERLRPLAPYGRIMTGTPITRSPLDVYSQFSVARPGMLGSSYYAFRARYGVTQTMHFGGRKVKVVVGYRNLEELRERLEEHSFMVTKEECLDLPPKVYERRVVELTKEQQAAYAAMRDEAILMLEDGQLASATIVIKQILRLHQIACGHLVTDEGTVVRLPTNRLEALDEALDEARDKVIIWASYRDDVARIVEHLTKRAGTPAAVAQFHGGNTDTRQEEVRRWKSDELCPWLVATQAAGGYGNTWIEADSVIYYSNSYDLELRLQSEDRAHRAGQRRSVTYTDLVATGTVDERILTALRKKLNLADAVMGRVREWLT